MRELQARASSVPAGPSVELYASPHPHKRRRLDSSSPFYSQSHTPFSNACTPTEPSRQTTPSSTPISTPGQRPTPPPNHSSKPPGDVEVCFGMLASMVVSMPKHFKETVQIESFRSVYIEGRDVLEVDTRKTAGTISARDAAIVSALESDRTMLTESYLRYGSSKTSGGRDSQLFLCIVIYGLRNRFSHIGQYLRQCKVYLQHPLHCSIDVEYKNPHMLAHVRAGCEEKSPTTFQHLAKVGGNTLQGHECPDDALSAFETTETEEASPPTALRTTLFRHQRQALAFMCRRERGWTFPPTTKDIWRAEHDQRGHTIFINSISDERSLDRPMPFSGGILADTMGLGKSLSAIALIANDKDMRSVTRTHTSMKTEVGATLLVVKAPLVHTWHTQFQLHIKPGHLRWRSHHGSNKVTSVEDISETDVIITTFHTLLAEWKRPEFSPSPMYTVHWRRIILDEAHDIRDCRSATCKAICDLEATSRWAVTGTPIQNCLMDLLTLLQFLRLQAFGRSLTWKGFIADLVIKFGQHDAAQRLRELVRCIMLRRSLSVVEEQLPKRHDTVCYLDFTSQERDLYSQLRQRARNVTTGSTSQAASNTIMQMFTRCRMVCNMGLLWQQYANEEVMPEQEIWDQSTAQAAFNLLVASDNVACRACYLSAATPGCGDGTLQPLMFPCGKVICGACRSGNDECGCPVPFADVDERQGHQAHEVLTLSSVQDQNVDELLDIPCLPTKINAVLQDIRAHQDEEKSVVLSFWTSTLNIIEQALKERDIQCIRFDGTVDQKVRNKNLTAFKTKPAIRVALLSISCGAVGLDITAASRVYLLEPQWNPSVEQQALARVYRLGQTRPVTTIRYIMRNTLEEHVLKVQREKQELSDLILSESSAKDSTKHAQLLQAML